MHRSCAAMFCFVATAAAACGGRIAQGGDDNSDATNNGSNSGSNPNGSSTNPPNGNAFDAGVRTPTSNPTPNAGSCGDDTCGSNEECCIGGSPGGNEGDPSASLESCVPSGTCNTDVLNDCYGTMCGTNSICCLTINPTTSHATAGCAASCGGNGAPAVQLCAKDEDCPAGSTCFTASWGPNGEGETTQICSGAR